MANKEYRNHQKIPQCNEGPEKDICSIEETWRASPESKLTIQCDLSICKGHPVSVTGIHPLEGVVDKEKEGYTFNNSTALERFLGHFVIVNTLRKFSFCFLRCKTGRKKYAQQILMFPPLLDIEDSEFLPDKKDPSLININIVMLDSVSRAHFYRTLPKTVSTLRNIVYNKSINATVLDFELLQSSAPFTFHNIRAFMSGKSDFDYIEHSNGTYQIEVLYKKMKNQGYYTLLQEDSCWFDEWGSLFTNNIFQNKTPHSRKEFQNRWSGFQDVVNGYHVDDYGLSYSSCDVFKQYNVTNQFNRPLKICFGGKVYSELFLDYSLSVFQGYIDSGKRQPIFAYTHLNAGHEVTGTITKTRVLIASVVAWIVSAVLQILGIIDRKISITVNNVFIVAFLAYIIFCNVMVYRETRRHERQIADQQVSVEARQIFLKDKKAFKVTRTVVVIVIFGYLPFMTFTAFSNTIEVAISTKVRYIIFNSAIFLALVNSLLNPLVYSVRLRQFRVALIEILLNKSQAEAEKFDDRRFGSVIEQIGKRNKDVNRVVNAADIELGTNQAGRQVRTN